MREHADLPVEGEDEQRQSDDGEREDDEDDADDRPGGGGDVDSAAEGGHEGEHGEAPGPEQEMGRPALGGAEAPAAQPLHPAQPRVAEGRDEAEPERDRRVRARRQRDPEDQEEADDRLRGHDRPAGLAGVARREAVGGQPVGQVLPAAQLRSRGPEQDQADDDPGDGRQLNHCRS